MTQPVKTAAKTKQYSGTTVFPPNDTRSHFFVVMTGGSGTVAFGPGGAQIPLADGHHYSPQAVPTNEITIVGVSNYVVHCDQEV